MSDSEPPLTEEEVLQHYEEFLGEAVWEYYEAAKKQADGIPSMKERWNIVLPGLENDSDAHLNANNGIPESSLDDLSGERLFWFYYGRWVAARQAYMFIRSKQY